MQILLRKEAYEISFYLKLAKYSLEIRRKTMIGSTTTFPVDARPAGCSVTEWMARTSIEGVKEELEQALFVADLHLADAKNGATGYMPLKQALAVADQAHLELRNIAGILNLPFV